MSENQELTGQAGGVGEAAATGVPAQTGAGSAVAVPPTTEGVPATAGEQGAQEVPLPAQAGARVELTELSEFRLWQAARDRTEGQLRRQLQEEQRQREETQRQLEQFQLENADPEERAAYYQQQVAETRAQAAVNAAQAQERNEVLAQAQTLLNDLGLDAGTPGLEWSDTPSWDGLARLAASAARIKGLQAQELAKQQGTVVTEATQAAKVEALRAAGVTQVSTATGAATPTDLRTEYENEKAALRGTGDVGAYARLKTQYREKGLEV